MQADGGVITVNAASRPVRGRPRSLTRMEEVLACAAAMFSSRGYAATTLEDIGTKLGMTRPALYHYVKSKEDLLEKSFEWARQHVLMRVRNELGEGTGRELLERFFLIYSEVMCDDASRCFLFGTSSHGTLDGHMRWPDRGRAVIDIATDLLSRGMADGTIAPCDRKYAVSILFGAFSTLPSFLRENGPSPREMGAEMLKILLNGLEAR